MNNSGTVSCRCGCVPSNVLSLFQMSELREKKKSQDKKYKKALSLLIENNCSSNSCEDSSTVYKSLDLHGKNLASCHLFFDNFLLLSDSLTSLQLDHNQLNFIPNGILKSLPLLRNLALHNNQLDTLSSEIGLLKHLEHLRLDCNALTTLPVELMNCSSLQYLRLTGNLNLKYLDDDIFANMPQLSHVFIDQCPLLRSLPVSLQCSTVLAFVVADDSCEHPPPTVLASGHDAIRQFFLAHPHAPATISVISSNTDIVTDMASTSIADGDVIKRPMNTPVLLNTETHDMHRDNALRYLELKRSARMTGTDRCEQCWHMSTICICDRLPQIALNEDIELVVYMDSKEVFNAGDDAKLLSIVCPNQTKSAQSHPAELEALCLVKAWFIYAAEDAELVAYISSQCECNPDNRVVVLFPSSRAVSSDDFIATWRQGEVHGVSDSKEKIEGEGKGNVLQGSGETLSPTCVNMTGLLPSSSRKLMIIVVDAVWRHARRMAQRLHQLLPEAMHVQLTPEQFSVYARKQSQPDRICTVEATALFLSHIEAADSLACDQLVQCVRINNDAIRPPSTSASTESTSLASNSTPNMDRKQKYKGDRSGDTGLYSKDTDATHPCWYYGKVFHHTHGELKAKQVKAPKQKRRYL